MRQTQPGRNPGEDGAEKDTATSPGTPAASRVGKKREGSSPILPRDTPTDTWIPDVQTPELKDSSFMLSEVPWFVANTRGT